MQNIMKMFLYVFEDVFEQITCDRKNPEPDIFPAFSPSGNLLLHLDGLNNCQHFLIMVLFRILVERLSILYVIFIISTFIVIPTDLVSHLSHWS